MVLPLLVGWFAVLVTMHRHTVSSRLLSAVPGFFPLLDTLADVSLNQFLHFLWAHAQTSFLQDEEQLCKTTFPCCSTKTRVLSRLSVKTFLNFFALKKWTEIKWDDDS